VRILLAIAIALPLAQPAAASACALRAETLRALFAAANEGSAVHGRALGAASAEWAAQGCGALELAVDELWVRVGETRSVPGGARILATNGAAVLGALEVRGAGGIALATVLGDLVLDGTVDARGASGAPVRLEARTGNVRVGRAFSLVAPQADVAVTASAGAILVTPRVAIAPAPFPPGAVLTAFHELAPAAGLDATELSGR
jgi:hypothetical protein